MLALELPSRARPGPQQLWQTRGGEDTWAKGGKEDFCVGGLAGKGVRA